ncbi:MAG: ankyrin repeat domain-containing protein [Treponemataceae bacterium]|nr:ankyrin repeat domain-containing protein [Treponemataceae bacterium]
MKGMGTLRKSAVIATVCLALLCLPSYTEPTPEQVKARTNLLVAAIENNDVDRAKLCIKLGADVNINVYCSLDNWGRYCVTTNRNKIHYGQVDTYTLLTYALAYEKSKDIVELLIKAGADVNVKSYYDDVFMPVASRKGWKDITELLIKSGTDVNAKTNNGWTALMSAAGADNKDTVELLIKVGANVNAKTNDSWTALMSAAGAGHKDTVELLIKTGADVNAKDNNGQTALMQAARVNCEGGNYRDTAELLIKAGADVNVKSNDGWTALMWAAVNNKKDVAETLIKAGSDSGATLIWVLNKTPHSDATKLLIKAGADVNAKDSEGISALTYAMLYGQNDIADLLRAAGAKE